MRARTRALMRTGPVNSEPPWTMRWPTASILPAAPTQPARSPAPTPPGKLRDASSVSPASRTESFRLLEPALTTRIRDAASPNSGGPDPVPDRWFVLAVGPGVGAGLQPVVLHELANPGGLLAETGHPVDHIHDEVEAVEVVQHDHVERGGRGPLLLVAADVEIGVVGAAIGQAVDQRGVPVISEDHLLVRREEGVELGVGQAVGMLARRLQAHEVDDVDHAHLQVRQVPADEVH